MKNRKAKRLMIGCVKSRDNGECYILASVSIKTSDLTNGSVMAHSDYIGDLDSNQAMLAVCEFLTKLSFSKKDRKKC